MRRHALASLLLSSALSLSVTGCETSEDPQTPDVDVDSDTDTDTADADTDTEDGDTGPEVSEDTDDGETQLDTDEVDTVDSDTDEPLPEPGPFRVIGGMSMGAMAVSIAAAEPERFHLAGALGGYADSSYMMSQMLRLHFSGFCELPVLEAALANDEPLPTCEHNELLSELEFPQNFNRFHFDTNGLTMHRGFYLSIIDNYAAAFGNLTVPPHADSPLIPAGIDLEWFLGTPDAERCANNRPIDPRYAFNAEYNPEGRYAVYPLCDHERPWVEHLSPATFQEDVPQTLGSQVLLFVDLNGNARREAGEPLLLNPWERFEDVGLDGCADVFEDGQGGCLTEARTDGAEDPNQDNFHWELRPSGLDRNGRYDEGEPFVDFGLDGVSAAVAGFADEGEGNNRWDALETLDNLLAHDADTLLKAKGAQALEHLAFWFDAGIRDALQAGVATRNIVAALREVGREVSVYKNFHSSAESFAPDQTESTFGVEVFSKDLSEQAVGRDIYVEYGRWDATEAEIAAGDGKHVGTDKDAVNRIFAFLAMAFWRAPQPDLTPEELTYNEGRRDAFYSHGLQARRGFTIAVPPGYDHPNNADKRYPVVYFLHGLGQEANDLMVASLLTGSLMADGTAPKAITVFPDGACCFIDTLTGERECACESASSGVRKCTDPTCEGALSSCEVRTIPTERLVRECKHGSMYADMLTDRWGEGRVDMNYKQSVYELVDYVDAHYRTRR